MKHDHGLENKLTAWFQRNPLKKAAIGYLTGIVILVLLVALVKFLIEREKEVKKRRQIAVTPKNKAPVFTVQTLVKRHGECLCRRDEERKMYRIQDKRRRLR